MTGLLKQPSLVYLALHSVGRSINVLSTWIRLHLPYLEFYHKHISHENQRKEPQKIKATFYRYILLVAVSFPQLWKPICGILLDWNRYFILWRLPKEDSHTLDTCASPEPSFPPQGLLSNLTLQLQNHFLLLCPQWRQNCWLLSLLLKIPFLHK